MQNEMKIFVKKYFGQYNHDSMNPLGEGQKYFGEICLMTSLKSKMLIEKILPSKPFGSHSK